MKLRKLLGPGTGDQGDVMIISADTIVVKGKHVLEKPADLVEAKNAFGTVWSNPPG